MTTAVDSGRGIAKSDPIRTSNYVRIDHRQGPGTTGRNLARAVDSAECARLCQKPKAEVAETAASIVAREWKFFEATRVADRGQMPTKYSAAETN